MSQSYLFYYCCTLALALILVALQLDGINAARSRQSSVEDDAADDYPLPDPDVFVAPSTAKAHRSPSTGSSAAAKTKKLAASSSTISQSDNRLDRRANYLSDYESNDSGNSDDNNNYINSYDNGDDNPITREKVINLLRKSNLLLPSFDQGADYELIANSRAASLNDNIDDDQIEALLRNAQLASSSAASAATSSGGSDAGKIIHAPTHHHYYLNSHPQSSSLSRSTFEGLIGDSAASSSSNQVSTTRRLHPGEPVYGSYEATAFGPIGLRKQHQHLHSTMDPTGPSSYGMLLNKTNDIYFLVMVGAFCVMAMAVVLAAGMFAYRVQQQRKSSSDTDYPTYGVVGPSIMNGKCGAAAFVGGYLGGPGGGGSVFGSKSGSKSHLAESVTSGDSGLAASEKSSSAKRTGSSPSSLEHHQQQATGGQGNKQSFVNNQSAARMYQHYQNQKQHQIIMASGANANRNTSASDLDSEDENDDGSYTVYECPGLASAHEMEIKNPLFNDDRRP